MTKQRKNIPLTKGLVLFAATLSLTAFQNHADAATPKRVQKFVSSWSQNIKSTMVFLKLDTKALLETAKTNPTTGELEIDSDQLAQIQKEQADLEAQLKELSPNISVLYRYHFVMNGMTVVAPAEFYDAILALKPVKALSEPIVFDRPAPMNVKAINDAVAKAAEKLNTTDFIGATRVHEEFQFKGQGIHVGVIDSGIDYTHAMFNGPGTVEAYQSVDPTQPSEFFPSEKVVGGYDFVGDSYNPGSILSEIRIPSPDSNPIDTSGHGTHVAGTVAGVGFDDKSFDGIAPEAKLHALKVFGPDGGTSDLVVMAAMEHAVDPNGDFNPADRLHVLNLSLGGMFGKKPNNYQEAVKNLSRAGIIVTASAGNSGAIPYIVGSPSTADAALSVGASIDGMEQNWKFGAVNFVYGDGSTELAEAVEGPISLPISEAQGIKGPMVDVGLGNEPLSEELAAAVKGKIAMLTRGGEAFSLKFTNAIAAGAIGVVMVNNQTGAPIPMGGDGQFPIPGIMLGQEVGEKMRARLAAGEEIIVDYDGFFIERQELIDTLTSFSSQGPRSEDGRLKPEIVAPGYQILSAAAGSGTNIVAMNGTSMSAPQMAGVMALMRQAYPTLSAEDLQAIVMNTAKPMVDAAGELYSLSRQGAGRVQVYEAITASIVAGPRSISFGEQKLPAKGRQKEMNAVLSLKDLNSVRGSSPKSFTLKVESALNMRIELPTEAISLKANDTDEVQFKVFLTQDQGADDQPILSHEAVIQVRDGSSNEVLARIPLIAIGVRASAIEKNSDAQGLVEIQNLGPFAGEVLPFNLLARGERFSDLTRDSESVSIACNMINSGVRFNPNGVLEFGFEVDRPVTRWESCTMIVLFSINGGTGTNEEADFELVGSSAYRIGDLPGVDLPTLYSTLLFDAELSRKIRADYEQAILDQNSETDIERPSYVPALLDYQPMALREHGRVATMGVTLETLKALLKEKGLEGSTVQYRVGILNNTNSAFKYDHFLFEGWKSLSLEAADQPLQNMPTRLLLEPGQRTRLPLTRGADSEDMLLLFPDNY